MSASIIMWLRGHSQHMFPSFRHMSAALLVSLLLFLPLSFKCAWIYAMLFIQRGIRDELHSWSDLDFDCAQGHAGNPAGEDGDEGRLTPAASQLSQVDRWENHLKPELISLSEREQNFRYLFDLPWWNVSQAGWSERARTDRQQMSLQKKVSSAF